jgi:hypothetical protein
MTITIILSFIVAVFGSLVSLYTYKKEKAEVPQAKIKFAKTIFIFSAVIVGLNMVNL